MFFYLVTFVLPVQFNHVFLDMFVSLCKSCYDASQHIKESLQPGGQLEELQDGALENVVSSLFGLSGQSLLIRTNPIVGAEAVLKLNSPSEMIGVPTDCFGELQTKT